ncbi:hypothetical protein [Ideonella sp. A 288]|uniref:hypothetical protein n=1 Tax=Ideonella sp. A 288 TaxID=1962181 RepID=UPI000B4ACDD0|nr:hypothetical protein [Ideonella sp. A 288]
MLSSTLFRTDARLQAAATSPSFHVTRGDAGPHVSRLQLALLLLGHNSIDGNEWRCGAYGDSTAATVLAYKRARDIVNRSYQKQADDIVGVMTLARLDAELCGLERLLPPRAARYPQDRLRDSAAMFELRRSVAHLRHTVAGEAGWSVGGPPGAVPTPELPIDPATVGTVVSASQDMAVEFVSILSSSDQSMVGPRPGGQRERICNYALGRRQDVGQPFDSNEVRGCWDVVEPKPEPPKLSVPPKPMDIQWCGIYASYLWRESGLSDIRWIWKSPWGIHKGKAKLGLSNNMYMLAPGDILINNQDPNHHILILKIARDRKTADILQGNSGNYSVAKSLVTRDQNHALPALTRTGRSGTHTFVSVDTALNPGLRYA